MLFEVIWVDSIWIVDTASDLSDTDQFGSSLNKEFWGEVSDVSETLNDETLSTDSLFNAQFSDSPVIFKKLSGAVEDTQTSWFSSSWGASLPLELSGGDGIGVDVGVAVILLISGFHPTHFSFTGSEVWARDIDSCAEGVFLGESDGVLSGDSLKFLDGVIFRVDWDAALCASVWQIDDGALDAHQTGQGFDFFETDVFSESGTTLCGEFVGLVLASVGLDGLNLSVFCG